MAIFQEDDEVTMAKCGDNIRIRLKNAEEEVNLLPSVIILQKLRFRQDAMSGFVLCGTHSPVKAVTAFEAQLAILEYKSIICAGNMIAKVFLAKQFQLIFSRLYGCDACSCCC